MTRSRLHPVLSALCVLSASAFKVSAAEPPQLPKLNDPALRLEALATYPDVEAPTTVCGAPDGSFYVGCDVRDARLNTDKPECFIARYSGMGADRKRTVFADKIYSPAGSAWWDGWLYVIHDPYLTRFRDTNGDGVADEREDLVTNLGVMPYGGLNDHCASGFTMGMDGYFYISIGDRGTYQTKSLKDGSTVSLLGGGIIRCRPDGSHLEIFSTGTRNHLAVLLDAEDNAFTRDNTDDGNGWWTRLTHHIEGGYYGYPYDYQKAPNYGVVQPSQQTLDAMKRNAEQGITPPLSANWPEATFLTAMADFGGGSPTGGVCYLSDGLPEHYLGKLLFTEWGKGTLTDTEVARDGATFKLVKDTAILEGGKGVDFRPMQVSVANDGSLLIADWGYGGWKGPKTVGNVYRLSWPGAKPAPRLKDESKASVEELLAALNHPDRDQRLRAQNALRYVNATEAVAKLAMDPKAPRLARIHAAWVIAQLPATPFGKDGSGSSAFELQGHKVFASLLADSDPAIKIQAMRGLAFAMLKRTEPLSTEARHFASANGAVLKAAAVEANAAVRLNAITSLGQLVVPGNTKLLADGLSDSDAWIRFVSRRALQRYLANSDPEPLLTHADARIRNEAWLALGHAADAQLVPVFARLAEKNSPVRARAVEALGHVAYEPKAWDGHWWGTQPVKSPAPLGSVAWAGTAPALDALTHALGAAETDVRLAAAKAFSGMILDTYGSKALAALRGRLTTEQDSEVRRQLIEALGVQKDPAAMSVFTQIALDEKADADFRATAIGAVVNIGGDEAKKTIARLANAQLSVPATRRVIQAAGELKVMDAAPALIARLKDENAGNREYAVKALRELGVKSGATQAIIGVLADKDGRVQAAAVETLGSYKDKAALPALLEFGKTRRARRETINAVASMADSTALPFLVDALREKGTGERRAAIGGLRKMRTEAWPLVQELLASGRVAPEFVPEIRMAFESGIIGKWKLVGPFENVWGAVHPPETDALAGGDFLKKKYVNAEGKETGWTDATGSGEDGHLNLERIFKSNGMVCAYAFTEIESTEDADAKLFCGSDDQIAVWLNGKKVHDSGAGSRGFNPDQDEVTLHLKKGRNALLVKAGNAGGGWVFAARIPGSDDGKFTPSKEPAFDEKQRAFVLAAKPDGSWVHAGDATRGAKIFGDPTGPLGAICATCHTVRGKGGQIGPDLSAIAVNYRRPELLVSLLEPSKTIALGFEQAMVQTKAGETLAGALRQETAEALTLVGADGQPHVVKKSDIKSQQHLPTSLMPPGLTMALKPEDVADLLAYLETLKGQ